jgi:hypothetical protein
VADQELLESGGLSIAMFLRAGGAPPDVNFVDWYIDGGFVFKGFVPGRAPPAPHRRNRTCQVG